MCVYIIFFVTHFRYGLTFMLLASLAAGLFFTILVWVDSHTWIYIRKRYASRFTVVKRNPLRFDEA